MELRHLRYFVATAEEQSISRAAERLWSAQPGLSAQMRHFEAELGIGLLERHSRGVRHAGAGRNAFALGSAEWVALMGAGHPLAGLGPLPAADLEGERIAIAGHRDSAVLDSAVAELLTGFGVTAELVSAPWPTVHATIAVNDTVGLTTAAEPVPRCVISRRLEPRRTLSFELLRRGEVPSAATAAFADLAATHAEPPTRALVAAA